MNETKVFQNQKDLYCQVCLHIAYEEFVLVTEASTAQTEQQ